MTTLEARPAPSIHPATLPGILEGIDIRGAGGLSGPGAVSDRLVVHPGAALSGDGKIIAVDRPVEVDLTRALSPTDRHGLELVLTDVDPSRDPSGSQLRVQRRGAGVPPGAARIALLTWSSTTGLVIAPVYAGLGARRLAIGSPGRANLVVAEGETVATGTVTILGDRDPSAIDDGCLVVGLAIATNVRVDGGGIEARVGEQASELQLQRNGGDTRFGGPVEGPERHPLNVVGGSDLSLGGGGVLMLGRSDGPNLVLDENELMARDSGRSAPLAIQWDGGETRFGGPLRGPADGPLRIIGGNDLSLGGDGVLMIGSRESHHLVLDENEIMAGNGTRTADLHLQWQGGGTSFGGPLSGPSQRPLTIVGARDASLPGGGFLSVGSEDQRNVTVDDRRILARDGGQPATLEVQADGGTTRFGGPVQLTAQEETANDPSGAWDLRLGVDDDAGHLELRHDEQLMGWFEPDGSGRLVTPSDQKTATEPSEMRDVLDVVRRLRPVTYRGTSDSDRATVGFLAEEVAEVAPELVSSTDGTHGVCLADFAVIAIAAIKEQQQRIDGLEQAVAALSEEAAL